jgi:hypothetical protein
MFRFVQTGFFIIAVSSLLAWSSRSQPRVLTQQSSSADEVATVPWRDGGRSISQLKGGPETVEPRPQFVSAKFDRTLVHSIRESSNFLKQRWAEDPERKPIPKVYLESLELDASQISRAENASNDETVSRQQLNSMLKDVADDLEIKASHCKSSSKGWASLISVEIKTLKADQSPAKGLAVWYVPKGWADTKDRWLRCSKLSTPTNAGNLPPGLYMLRVENFAPVPIRIGGDGKDTQTVELLAP